MTRRATTATLGGPVAKNLSDAERLTGWPTRSAPSRATRSSSAPGTPADAQELLGAARGEIARRCGLIDESAWAFCWVVDAPMFETVRDDKGDESGWTAVHHPFTSPNAEWIDRFEDDPGEALAYAYDIVCNGNEIGGGSIRIHRGDVQQRVFDAARHGTRPSSGRSSASCSTRSSTARRRTAASRSAGTAPACCSPAPTRSAR